MAENHVYFFSDGLKLSATLYIPDDYKKGEKRAGIVILQGFTANKEMFRPREAKYFSKAGYVVLTFDYRGFGASEGARGELIPLERVEDARNAVTYLGLQPEVDKDKIGMVGHCFGGGVATYATAIDERIKCLAVPGVIGNGRRWLRSTRRLYEWEDFLKQLEEDRNRRVLTGESKHVPTFDIAPPDPEVRERHAEFKKKFNYVAVEPSLRSAEAIINFAPDELAHKISPRPILIFAATKDLWADSVENARIMYQMAKEPKKLVILEGCTHFGMAQDEPYISQVEKGVIEWFHQYLPPL